MAIKVCMAANDAKTEACNVWKKSRHYAAPLICSVMTFVCHLHTSLRVQILTKIMPSRS